MYYKKKYLLFITATERLVRNVAAKVIEVSAMDVVLCFQPEGNGEKEPIRLKNDEELEHERGGKTEIL